MSIVWLTTCMTFIVSKELYLTAWKKNNSKTFVYTAQCDKGFGMADVGENEMK